MGKNFNNAVRKHFARRMSDLSEFTPYAVPKGNDNLIIQGERLFKRERDKIADWVSLIPSPKGYNSFSIQCGFSRHKRFPLVTMRPSILDLDSNSLSVEEGFFILRSSDKEYCEEWNIAGTISVYDAPDFEMMMTDVSQDEADDIAKTLVDSSFIVLQRYGIPILDAIT